MDDFEVVTAMVAVGVVEVVAAGDVAGDGEDVAGEVVVVAGEVVVVAGVVVPEAAGVGEPGVAEVDEELDEGAPPPEW